MDKLLPCPFCGGSAEAKWLSGPGWLVKCKKCGARTIGGINLKDDERKAVEAWNRRAEPETGNPISENTPLSNADAIRAMSDEELAKIIIEHELVQVCKEKQECIDILDTGGTVPDAACEECALAWLRQPVGEGSL